MQRRSWKWYWVRQLSNGWSRTGRLSIPQSTLVACVLYIHSFSQVGSDSVHKVLDDRSMAYSLSGMATAHNNMMSMYSTGGNSGLYARPMPNQQYSQLDSKPAYSSAWTLPYSEDTSPVDAYPLDQPPAYLPQSTAIANTNMYTPAYRWTQPTAKSLQQGSTYFDQDLQFAHTNGRLATPSDVSPLNTGMSSLQLTIPERPHPRQPLPLDSSVPRRQLPMPQPSPAQSSHVVDQMQDARLRSAQAIGTSGMDGRGSFAKSLLPWTTDSESHANASGVASADAFTQPISPAMPDNAESSMSYMPNTTSTADDATATTAASQLELNFSTSGLLEGMSAPAPATNYSYVRETRPMTRPASQTNLYSYSPDSSSKRNSISGESSSDCTLVSGHRYTPLSHSQTRSSPGNRSLHRESCQNRNMQPVQLHRTSMGNLNSTY